MEGVDGGTQCELIPICLLYSIPVNVRSRRSLVIVPIKLHQVEWRQSDEFVKTEGPDYEENNCKT